ncbi:hypothetical protein Tco_0662346 [Tanacetum coccineum]
MSNSPTVSPFLKNSTVHILHTNAKTFADDVLLSTYDGVGTGRITMKKNNDNGLPKEPNKEWKLNEKAAGNGGGCLEVKSIDLTSLC